jgi:hypothetical protein
VALFVSEGRRAPADPPSVPVSVAVAPRVVPPPPVIARPPIAPRPAPPAAEPRKPTRRSPGVRVATAPGAREGIININSIPVSAVLLDGRPLGGTPHVGVTVSPGEHRVVFIHPERGRRYQTVNVDVGRTVLAAVRFQ